MGNFTDESEQRATLPQDTREYPLQSNDYHHGQKNGMGKMGSMNGVGGGGGGMSDGGMGAAAGAGLGYNNGPQCKWHWKYKNNKNASWKYRKINRRQLQYS